MKKNVLITGGTKGIGRAIAAIFLEAGDRVSICSRSGQTDLKHKNLTSHSVDVRDRAAVKAWIDQASATLGGIDVLVNCAGISKWRPLESVEVDFLDEIFYREGSRLSTAQPSFSIAHLITLYH